MPSLYEHGFALLAPPARTALSIGDEQTRARLPDFATVDELSSFVERLFVYRFPIQGIFIQAKVGASLMCALILVSIAVLSRRMYENSFWIMRTMKRPSGVVLVPNSMLCFTLIEGLYAIIFVAWLWEYVVFYESRSRPPTNYVLWLQMPWFPLILGACWAAWGTFFATPTTSQSAFGAGQNPSWIKRFLNHSLTISAFALFSPLLILTSILVPAVWGNTYFQRALHQQQDWQTRYAGMADFTQEMVVDAQRVWYDLLPAMRLSGITMLIWTFWAFAMFITYTTIAVRLILRVRQELRKAMETKGAYSGLAVSTWVPEKAGEGDDEVLEEGYGGSGQNEDRWTVRYSRQSNRQREEQPVLPPTSSQPIELDGRHMVRKASDATTTWDVAELHGEKTKSLASPNGSRSFSEDDSVDVQPHARPVHFETPAAANARQAGAAAQTAGRPGRRTLMPNILMQRQVPATMRMTASERIEQRKALRKAFVHMCIQAFTISPACVSFGTIACLLGVGNYAGTEQPHNGGTRYELVQALAVVMVTWTTVAFASITLIAIGQRTYESVLTVAAFPSLIARETHGSSAGSRAATQHGVRRSAAAVTAGSNVTEPQSPSVRSPNRQSLPLPFLGKGRDRRASATQQSNVGSGASTGNMLGIESSFFETHTQQQQLASMSMGGAEQSFFETCSRPDTAQRPSTCEYVPTHTRRAVSQVSSEGGNRLSQNDLEAQTAGRGRAVSVKSSNGDRLPRHKPRAYHRNDEEGSLDDDTFYSEPEDEYGYDRDGTARRSTHSSLSQPRPTSRHR